MMPRPYKTLPTPPHALLPVEVPGDIPKELRGTPLGRLLAYHNLGVSLPQHKSAELLVCMCMDNRKQLRLPENFAYILRTGGGNIRHSEFKVSYAVAIGGVRHIALIAHDGCGMVNLSARRKSFVSGLVEGAGWSAGEAMAHFNANAPHFEIGNEIIFVCSEARRLGLKYPKIKVVPMFYRIADGKLYLIRGGSKTR
jgi:carbonic anhydrase